MDQKTQLVGDPLDPITRPTSTSTVDDSEFEFHDDTSTLYTPRTSIIENTHSDLPPTYEQSQAAIHESAGIQPPPAFPYPRGAQNHSNITVYRTELPPDPIIPIRGQGEDNGGTHYPNEKERPIPPTGPKASGLLSEALRFTETPPPTSEHQRLRFPVAIPSITQDTSIAKFARFFAVVLETQAVTASEFLDFIDGLNALATASSFSTSTFHSRSALSSFEVPRDDADIAREDLISAYITLSNTHFFNPRGLQVQITDLTQLADLVNMSNPAIRKAILGEVLRNSKAGVDVSVAAHGAAHAAAEAMVPYIEPLTTAVPEPKKYTESMESVASRLAALAINDNESIQTTQEQVHNDDSRARIDPSQSQALHGGPPTWAEWGDDFGRKWGKWGEYQGRKWGDWGQKQGDFWGKWGQEKGRKFEYMGAAIAQKAASPPWAWRGGGRGPAGRFCGRPFGNQGGPCGGGRNGPFGNGGPFGSGGGPFGAHGSPFGPHGSPFGGGGPFGRRAMTQPYAQPPPADYADVPIPPIPGQSSGHIPPPPNMPPMPAFPPHPSLHDVHHPPPPPPAGTFGLRGELSDNGYQEDEADDFDDAASISSSSTDSSTSSAAPSMTPSQVFSEKVAAIEAMAATACSNNTKAPPQIAKERVRAIHVAEKEKMRQEWAMEKRARKEEMKRDKNAWKEDGKKKYREWKGQKKAVKRDWKKGARGDYREWKEEMRRAKREGKRRDGGCESSGRGRGGRGGRHGHHHDHNHNHGVDRGFAGMRGGPSMESLGQTSSRNPNVVEDVEVRAKHMLWLVLTNYE